MFIQISLPRNASVCLLAGWLLYPMPATEAIPWLVPSHYTQSLLQDGVPVSCWWTLPAQCCKNGVSSCTKGGDPVQYKVIGFVFNVANSEILPQALGLHCLDSLSYSRIGTTRDLHRHWVAELKAWIFDVQICYNCINTDMFIFEYFTLRDIQDIQKTLSYLSPHYRRNVQLSPF